MRIKKGRYIITSALVLAILTAAGYAAVQNQISYVEKFETDRVNIEIQELTVSKTGESTASEGIVDANKDVSYIPRIINRNASCYVRVKVDIAADNKHSEPLGQECIYGLSEDWIKKGDYFYYTKQMSQGESTDVFKGVHIPEDWAAADAENLKVSVRAEAVQAKNFFPDFSEALPWGAVKLETVAKAENMNVCEAIPVRDASELKYSSEGSFEYNTSDIFDEFTGMMPGDRFEKTVAVKNDSNKLLRMYLDLASSESELGNALKLQILWEDNCIFDGNLSDATNMDKIKLAGMAEGEKSEMKITLELPAGAENEYQYMKDCLIWRLEAEAVSEHSAQTADWNSILPALTVLVFAGLAIVYVFGSRREEQ